VFEASGVEVLDGAEGADLRPGGFQAGPMWVSAFTLLSLTGSRDVERVWRRLYSNVERGGDPRGSRLGGREVRGEQGELGGDAKRFQTTVGERLVSIPTYYRLLYSLAFQFDFNVARSLLPSPDVVSVILSSTGRVRYVLVNGVRMLTLRPSDGFFTLSIEAGEIVRRASTPPRFRVVVKGGEVTRIKGSVLKPIVLDVDPLARPGDEIIVVDELDNLVGVGKLKLPPIIVKSLEKGEVARIRALREGGV
jgi:archaeosine-15-forming tRNA-guanine transglycosylase